MLFVPAHAFRGLAPKPPRPLRSLRGLGRLANPQESCACTPSNPDMRKGHAEKTWRFLFFSPGCLCYCESELLLRSLAGFVMVKKSVANKVKCDFHKLIHTGNHRNLMGLSIGLLF